MIARVNSGVSQKDIGKYLNLCQSVISFIETNKRELKFSEAQKLYRYNQLYKSTISNLLFEA